MSDENSVNKMDINVGSLDGDTLNVRFGKAKEIEYPKPVNISGNIQAPAEFYGKRKENHHLDDMHLEVNEDQGTITLYCDPSEEKDTVVTGRIIINPRLKNLGINDPNRTYTRDEFARMLKMNRILFARQSDNTDLIAKVKDLAAKVNRQINKKDNSRGNRRDVFEQTAETDLPKTITLLCPLFVNGDKKEFSVDLCFDVGEDIRFWLESAELQESIDDTKKQDIADQVALFNDEIVIVYK